MGSKWITEFKLIIKRSISSITLGSESRERRERRSETYCYVSCVSISCLFWPINHNISPILTSSGSYTEDIESVYMCWCIHVHVHTICVQESVGVLREVYRGWPWNTGSLVVRDLDSYD